MEFTHFLKNSILCLQIHESSAVGCALYIFIAILWPAGYSAACSYDLQAEMVLKFLSDILKGLKKNNILWCDSYDIQILLSINKVDWNMAVDLCV